MLKHLEGARLGLFIFIGTALLVLSIFYIGNKNALFVETITIKSYFESISGLKNGAPVRLSGYKIGNVSKLTLTDDLSGKVEVTMKIDYNLRRFIRLDSEASIETEGLVGKKIISITPGSEDSPIIEDGSFLKSIAPLNVSAVIKETQEIMAYIKLISKDFAEIVEKVNKGNGSIGKLVNDDALYNSTVEITQTANKSLTQITEDLEGVTDFILTVGVEFESIVTNVDTIIADTKGLLQHTKRGEGLLGQLVYDETTYDSIQAVISSLIHTSISAEKGMAKFAENMEAMKHNWLFKTYFEERGFWDETEYMKELKSRISTLTEKIEELKALDEKLKKEKARSEN